MLNKQCGRGGRKIEELEGMSDFKVTMSFRYNRTDTHINSKTLAAGTSSQMRVIVLRGGNGYEIPYLVKTLSLSDICL